MASVEVPSTKPKAKTSFSALIRCVPPGVLALFHIWESYQVELQGSYSVPRLQELVAYHSTTSRLRGLATAVVTPFPCVLLIVLADVLPLQPPADGLYAQGAPYWIRTYFSVAVVTITSLSEFYHSSSRLPLRASQALLLTVTVTSITVVFILGLHLVVGFPTPFLYQFISAFWMPMLFSSMWTLWKTAIRDDSDARKDLQRFIWCWFSQLTMILVYPVFSYAFSTLSGMYQTWLSFLLPVWKLALKIWASYGVFRVEDSAPVFVVFTVDVFHALFLSSAMQSSSSAGSGALVVTMLIDAFQSCVAINYVWVICARIERLGATIDAMEAKDQSGKAPAATTSRASLFRAAEIVAASEAIRNHTSIAGSRHQRAASSSWVSKSKSEIFLVAAKPTQMARVYVATEHHERQERVDAEISHASTAVAPLATLSPLDQKRLAYARHTLQLLHMVEFYMLIEFTEVIVATVYSIYLVIMSQLANRAYYSQLRAMTHAQWKATVGHVMQYAALELLSFVALDLVLLWRLRYSPLQQLAFALRKHVQLVQSLLCLWVFFVIQLSLEHVGSDYSFKFHWIIRDEPPHGEDALKHL